MSLIKSAIIYHYWPHYRKSIASELIKQIPPNPEYILFSDNQAPNGIKSLSIKELNEITEGASCKAKFIKNIWLTKDIYWQSGVLKICLSSEFQTIIFLGNMYCLSTWLGSLLARLKGKRVIMWTHGFLSEENNIKEYTRRLFYKLSNAFLLYGNRAKAIMLKHGFQDKQLYVVYNSLDYNLQKKYRDGLLGWNSIELRSNFFEYPDNPTLVFIGRLTPQKKLEMLLKIVPILDKKEQRVNILLVGDGCERHSLKELGLALGISNRLHFFGPCYNENTIAHLITLSDICIAPGEVGLTAMHSLAYGTPVLTHDDFATQMPEFEAIIDGVNGAFFKKNDINDLAAKVSDWLSKINTTKSPHHTYDVIDKYYNPHYQMKVINRAVRNLPPH
jgi:glycosyltransferase involved in cell wall biosynthesis